MRCGPQPFESSPEPCGLTDASRACPECLSQCLAELLQRASDAQQHVLELRSRILGLTALNAELTRKIQSGVDETTAIEALEARNKQLQQQLNACNKEISGLQVQPCGH